MNLRALVKGLAASGPGRAGLACFGALALLSAYVLFTYPADFGPAHWGNPALWADHPRSAPPAWTNLFSRQPRPVHVALESDAPAERASAGAFETLRFELPFRHIAAEPPTFLSVSLKEIVYHQRPPIVDIFLIRPDGEELLLYRQVIAGPRPGEAPPYERHVSSPLRVVLSSEARAISAVQDLYERAYGMTLSTGEIRGRLESYLFGK